MNTHYNLFQNNFNWFKKNLNYLDITTKGICLEAEDKETCYAKNKAAFNFVVSVLNEQLDSEAALDLKYEKMDKFKTLRGDRDTKRKMNF